MNTYAHNATDRSVVLYLGDVTSNLDPATGVAAASWPTLTYHVPGAAGVAIPLSDKAAVADPHADGELWELGNGFYALDLPDAVFATVDAQVLLEGDDAAHQAIVWGGPIWVRSPELALGLDAIDVTQPAGLPTTMTQMIVWLWYRIFGKTEINSSTNKVSVFSADGTTRVLEQDVATVGDVKTVSAASPPA